MLNTRLEVYPLTNGEFTKILQFGWRNSKTVLGSVILGWPTCMLIRRNKNEMAVKSPVVSPSYGRNRGAKVSMVIALEGEFEIALLDLYRKWKRIPYHNLRFKEMVTKTNHIRFYKGPVATVIHLLRSEPCSTFKVLVEAGRIEWTVEWLITTDPKWKPLLTDRMFKKAKARIKAALATNTVS